MSEQITGEIKKYLQSNEEEIRDGAIIAGIALNAYNKDFDMDFSIIEKALHSYSQKVSLLSLSNVIEDKNVRKKYNSLIKKYESDGYSTVKRAAAFSEPLLWAWEKEKNQRKKVEHLHKDHKKLHRSYLEGVLLGLAVVANQLEPDAQEEIIRLYETIQENYYDEQILVSTCFSVALFGLAVKKSEMCVPILLNILAQPGKKIRASAAEALAFLASDVDFQVSLDIISKLIDNPVHQETWQLNLAIIITYFRHHDDEEIDQVITLINALEKPDPELVSLMDLIGENPDVLTFLTNAAQSSYSRVKLAVLFSTYYVERHMKELKLAEEDLKKFAVLCVVLLGDSNGFIRSFSLYRLLSLSITLNTSEYIENFKSHLNDQVQRNRLISSIAIIYLTSLYKSDDIENIKSYLMSIIDPQVSRGALIGLGMGSNTLIHNSETADEQILGLLELTSESTYIGYVLIVSTLL